VVCEPPSVPLGSPREATREEPLFWLEELVRRIGGRHMTEYVSGELGGKIKAIICEWSKWVNLCFLN
jgi:hypothetical protein